jgi:hypothetical protein
VTQEDFEKVKADVLQKPFADPEVPVHIDPAESIVAEVARDAGDVLCRDAVDARLVGDLLTFGVKGKLIADENEVGGHPATVNAQAAPDSDGDGIPDAWELKHNLNPHDPMDAQKIDPKTGYSNLELYLNELASQPARACPVPR